MLLERATHPQFVSNTYLLADNVGGPAFFIDAGGPVEALMARADRLEVLPTHVLLTHHHFDHVSEVNTLREHWPEIEVLISPVERDLLQGAAADAAGRAGASSMGAVEPGETLSFGQLEFARCTRPGTPPGCCPSWSPTAHAGGLVFTGDTLFKNSVGGVRAPGHTTYTDLRDSIMGTLMELPPDTVIHPGHAEPTTVAAEWDGNAFIRVWRGLDPEGAQRCTALGMPATLVLLGEDYDGGTKAWVRWEDGSDDIVPGSQVQQAG